MNIFLSKQFTAAYAALSVEAGELSLDDDVRRQVSELPGWKTAVITPESRL